MNLSVTSSLLTFLSPPPGLDPLTEFELVQIENTPGLFSLTAANGAVRLFVLDAALHLPDYSPRLPAAELAAIGTTGDNEDTPLILVVVSPGVQSTVNLSAPIVVNATSGACVQVILEGGDWPLHHPLAPAAS